MNKRRDESGAAFGRPATAFRTPSSLKADAGAEGLSQRDYFAAAALTGIMASPLLRDPDATAKSLARDAYAMADAMIEFRTEE